jgi:hypothetical protein
LVNRAGDEAVLPSLLPQIGAALGCDLARRNRVGDSTARMEQCGLFSPDLVERWRCT